MAIYSTQLIMALESSGGDHIVYTVPADGGPAILKNVNAVVYAGQHAQLCQYVSGDDWVLIDMDASASDENLKFNIPTWVVLPPGSEVSLYLAGDGIVTCVVSGYQFASI